MKENLPFQNLEEENGQRWLAEFQYTKLLIKQKMQ